MARRVLDAVREASSTADALERADETLAPLIGELALGEAGSEPSELRARLTVAAATPRDHAAATRSRQRARRSRTGAQDLGMAA